MIFTFTADDATDALRDVTWLIDSQQRVIVQLERRLANVQARLDGVLPPPFGTPILTPTPHGNYGLTWTAPEDGEGSSAWSYALAPALDRAGAHVRRMRAAGREFYP